MAVLGAEITLRCASSINYVFFVVFFICHIIQRKYVSLKNLYKNGELQK